MERINLKEVKGRTFPKEVVAAYGKCCDADNYYTAICKQKAPDPLFKIGQIIKVKLKHTGILETVKVSLIGSYDPYSHTEIDGRYYSFEPLKKDLTKKNRRNHLSCRDIDEYYA